MSQDDLFGEYAFGTDEKAQLDRDGHILFPGLLTATAQQRLTQSLRYIQSLRTTEEEDHQPNRYSAEYDEYLQSLIGHPQLLALARSILGAEIRFDHCVALNRPGHNKGQQWHTHGYGEEDISRGLGFVRIFFYVNGFAIGDGGLKTVPGSHLYKDRAIQAATDRELEADWMRGKKHPLTDTPLAIEALAAPPGTVIAMWTHALHGVSPKTSPQTRWTVVYAYRNPGLPSGARWISEGFEKKTIPGAEGLMSLY